MTGKPRTVHRHARPRRGQHLRRDDVCACGELAGDLPRRPARPHHRAPGPRGRIQFVQQKVSRRRSSTAARSSMRTRPMKSFRRRFAGPCRATPGPAYVGTRRASSSRNSTCRIRCRQPVRLVNQTAGEREVAEASELIRAAESPILLVGHGVHTSRTGAAVRELADLMQCPVIQTSGGTSFIDGLEDRTLRVRILAGGRRGAVVKSICASRSARNSANRATTAGPATGRRTTQSVNGFWSSRIRWPSASTVQLTSPWSVTFGVWCLSWWKRSVTIRERHRSISTARHQGGRGGAGAARGERADGPDADTPGAVSSSRPPKRSRRTASWSVTGARRSSFMNLFAGQAARRHLEPELRPPRHRLADRGRRSVAEGGKRPVMLQTSDSAFLFHIAELETAARHKASAGVCGGGRPPVGPRGGAVYNRTFEQPSPQPGVHWSKDVRLAQGRRGLRLPRRVRRKGREIGPAIERATPSGKTAVVMPHRPEGQFRGDAAS